ncbi:phosphoglycerate mutase family protein [Novilysobacter arseniciresistens]|uniref:phosphoglycerate mutase family protein n=1 Tax=Novilysobacter arseniciresistens TaxID=1385522 RepID=UPI00068FFC12|nr:phosphoglycerate mutase family protein [Lysobacter arseniciresistens]
MRIARLATLLTAALLAACATGGAPAPGTDAAVTFVVVRHAEKLADGSDDPPLTAEGHARAQALADSLAGSDVVAVYSTAYRRARATAGPTAQAHGVTITPYDSRQPTDGFAASLLRTHDAGTVLVVGHSNTAPAIAAALCGCEVAPMTEAEYGRRMTVHVDGDGQVTLLVAPLPR